MRAPDARPLRDDGFAMYIVIMAMTVILILAASLASGSVATITGVNADKTGPVPLQPVWRRVTSPYRLHLLNRHRRGRDQPTTSTSSNGVYANEAGPPLPIK